jgi:hypothetical protein
VNSDPHKILSYKLKWEEGAPQPPPMEAALCLTGSTISSLTSTLAPGAQILIIMTW